MYQIPRSIVLSESGATDVKPHDVLLCDSTLYGVTSTTSSMVYLNLLVDLQGPQGEPGKDAALNECELIASGETTEEVNGISVTMDNDGNPLSLRDVVTIYVYCPTAAQTANISININGTAGGSIVSGINNGGERYSRAVCVYSGKKWDVYSQVASGTSVVANMTSLNNHKTIHDSTVTSIKLFLYTASQVLPIGFKYEIYGRRA